MKKKFCAGVFKRETKLNAMLATTFTIASVLAAGSAFATDLDLDFAVRIGGTDTDRAYAIAVDDAGNSYVTGTFADTVDFDPGPGTMDITEGGDDDAYVMKLDTSGNLVWVQVITGTGTQNGRDIAVDDAGNVYVCGVHWDTTDFDPGPGTNNIASAGSSDLFVMKLNSTGDLLWARSIGDTGSDRAHSISLDTNGNVYTTGQFSNTVDFDPGAGTLNLTSSGNRDIFILKLDADGDLVWAKGVGGTGEDSGNAIHVDLMGDVYSTGSFEATVDFDPGAGTVNLSSVSNGDIFVLKLDAAGDFTWANGMGGTHALFSDSGEAITSDASGNVVVTGGFYGTVDFDPGVGVENHSSVGEGDLFIHKTNSSGDLIWTKTVGGTLYDLGSGVKVDDTGNIFTTGYFDESADFDPGAGTFVLSGPAFSRNVFISELDSAGDFVSARGFIGTGDSIGNDIELGSSGSVYVVGSFAETFDFDPGPGDFDLTSNTASKDLFVVKLSPPTPLLSTSDRFFNSLLVILLLLMGIFLYRKRKFIA